MNIGLIGCGGIAQVHAKSIQAIGGGHRLTAVADCEYERAHRMAEEYGARAYQDWEELLEQERLDVLHICTPHHLHTQMAVCALRRGVHVFLEKPPVISREQLAQLKEALAETAGQRLAVCFQNRLNPNTLYVKQQLEAGKFGKVLGARGIVTWCRGGAYYSESPWRGSLATEGGGALINQGIHTLDLIHYLIGDSYVSADAVCGNLHLAGRIEVEDTLAARIVYPEALAVFYVTTGYMADLPPVIELSCERGRVRMEGDGVRIWGDNGEEDMQFAACEGFGKSYWGAAHRDAIEGFYGSVERGEPYLLDFERVEGTVALMLDLYEKAREK